MQERMNASNKITQENEWDECVCVNDIKIVGVENMIY